MNKKLLSMLSLLLGLAGSQIVSSMDTHFKVSEYMYCIDSNGSVRKKRMFSQAHKKNSKFTGIVRGKFSEDHPSQKESKQVQEKSKQGFKPSKLQLLDLQDNDLEAIPKVLLNKNNFSNLKGVSVDIDPRGDFTFPNKQLNPDLQDNLRINCAFPNFTDSDTVFNERYFYRSEERNLSPQSIENDWMRIHDIVISVVGSHRMGCSTTPYGAKGVGHPIFNLISLFCYKRSHDYPIADNLKLLEVDSKIKSMFVNDASLHTTINSFGDTVLLHFLRAQIDVPEYDELSFSHCDQTFHVLLEKSDHNAQSRNGNTALHWALLSWARQAPLADSSLSFDQIKSLLKKGAKIDIANNAGVTPDMLLETVCSGKSWDYFTGEKGQASIINELVSLSQDTESGDKSEETSSTTPEMIDCDPVVCGQNYIPKQKAHNFGEFSSLGYVRGDDEVEDIKKGWENIAKILKAVPGKKHQMLCEKQAFEFEDFPDEAGVGHPIFQLVSCYLYGCSSRSRNKIDIDCDKLITNMLEEDSSLYSIKNSINDTLLLHSLRFQANEQDYDDCDMSFDIMGLLIKNSDLKAQSENGNTALHWAVLVWPKTLEQTNYFQVAQIKVLIKAGAKIDMPNKAGITPEMLMKTIYPDLVEDVLGEVKKLSRIKYFLVPLDQLIEALY